MSRVRSYEFFAIVRNFTRENEEVVARGDEELMRSKFEQMLKEHVDNNGDRNIYLVRITLVKAVKGDNMALVKAVKGDES